MDIHYNAFISYRHHPDDIRVAMEIHKGLERFKVPKAIKKRSPGPMRLFRDKEELPITSHLTDDIGHALENSDYLIVICSPHTKESVWVQREIETFLKTHSRDKVLTVLASGEPYDVIPDILLHEDVVDPITGQLQRREIEPLSCDWRMKKRKAVREELPRLAAPLLGCAYDELRQRQRQYRMRRTITFFSLALVASVSLMVYFIHTSIQIQKANDDLHAANVQIREANVQIQANLDEALRNQSEYLASAASERLEAGDRLTAIALTLEALPDENNDRPYVAAAEHALSDALGTYENSADVVAQGSYVADNLVSDFQLTQDGSRIYILDSRDVLTIWDTQTFQKLYTVDLGGYSVEEFYITGQGNILFTVSTGDSSIYCFDPEGTQLWKIESCMDMAFLDQQSVLLVLQDDFINAERILFLDPDTGEQVRDPLMADVVEGSSYCPDFLQENYQTGQPLTLEYDGGYSDDGEYSYHDVVLMDMQTGDTRRIMRYEYSIGSGQRIEAVGITQDGNVVIMHSDGSGIYNGKILNMETTSKARADVLCFDGKTGQLMWETEIVTYVYSRNSVVEAIPDSNWMLLQNGNTFLVCDSRTGEEIAQCQTISQPLTTRVYADQVWGVLENGASYSIYYAENSCNSLEIVDGTISKAVVNHGLYVHMPLEMQVVAYWSEDQEEGTPVESDAEFVPQYCQICGDDLLIDNFDEMVMLDARQLKERWSLEIGYGYDALGFSADGSEFWMWDNYEDQAVAFSVADGTQRSLEVPMQAGDFYNLQESNLYMAQDQLFYMLEAEDAIRLMRVSLQTGEVLQEYTPEEWFQEEITYGTGSHILLVTDDHAWIYREEGTLYMIDLHSGDAQLLAEGLTQTPSVTYDGSRSRIAAGVGNELHLMTPDGALVQRINLEDRKAVSTYFYGEQLLVLCDDGKLYRYDRTGNCLSQTSLNIFTTFAYDAAHPEEDPTGIGWWATEDGNLILNLFGAGNIIDCESWQAKAYVPNLVTYVPESDVLLCTIKETLNAYPRYTTEQLKAKGLEELGEFRLSQEQREYYGLS